MTARIERVVAYRVELPFVEGPYAISGGRVERGFDALVVGLHAEGGLVGWGEMAPLGATYAPAFAAGARAALEELAPVLLGLDAGEPAVAAHALERALRGHPYAKSPLDVAAWDLAAKAAARPLAALLGGRFGTDVALYRVVPMCEAEEAEAIARRLVEQGYDRLQVKVGDDPEADRERLAAVRRAVGERLLLFADANGGWSTADARRFLRGLAEHERLVVEQPCASIGECAALRAACPWPIALDESIDSLEALLEARAAGVADAVTIKIARVGGITQARVIRDAAVALHVPVTIEDTGGAEIATAAIAHLALSTPAGSRLQAYPMSEIVERSTADGLPPARRGRLSLPDGPGLGIEPRRAVLGEPFFEAAL